MNGYEKALQKASLYPRRLPSPLKGVDRVSGNFQGIPEHYAAFVVSKERNLVLHGIRGLSDTGRVQVNDWIEAKAKEPNRAHPKPAFLTVLFGKLFEDDYQIVSEALQAIKNLPVFSDDDIFSSDDDFFFDIILRALQMRQNREEISYDDLNGKSGFEEQLEQLISRNFTEGPRFQQAIEKLQYYGFNALINRLEETDEPEDELAT